MNCSHCSSAVEKALKGLAGVKKAVVSLEEKTAVVKYVPAKVDAEQMKEAVAQAGFQVI